jgi:serine/threonine protein kinase
MKKIKHTNVIRLLEVFESNKHLLMVMEYVGGGDLLHFIKSRGRMDENDARYLFKQICFGLAHIHC